MAEKNYGYIGPATENKRYFRTSGRRIGGTAVGIIKMGTSNILFFPGNVSNACSFNYPVHYVFAAGSDQDKVHCGDEEILPNLIKAAKELEEQGCRVIFASCGYFGHFQREVAESVDIPVYLSSLIQIPLILTGLKRNQKIGLLCSDAPRLTEDLFEACGVEKQFRDRCVIYGAENLPEFKNVITDAGNMDNDKAGTELVELAKEMVTEHPEIGAILLECTEMPPYAYRIQDAVGLPVFDFLTMINYFHESATRRPYYGFL